jgi:hypothetical protein
MSLGTTRKKGLEKTSRLSRTDDAKTNNNKELFLRMPWPAPEDEVLPLRAVQRGDPAVSAVAPYRIPHSKILIEMLNAPFRTPHSKILVEMLNAPFRTPHSDPDPEP